MKNPVYCLAYDGRRRRLCCGLNERLVIYDVHKPNPTDLMARKILVRQYVIHSHVDYIRGIVCSETKIYTSSYDRRLVVYDSEFPDTKFQTVQSAHMGAISVLARDSDNNLLMTGSFDKTVKTWTADLSMLQEFTGFPDTVSGVCYVPTTKTLWVATNSNELLIYDPRTGTDISSFMPPVAPENNDLCFQSFFFIPELGDVIGVANQTNLVVWQHNKHSASSFLKGHGEAVESLTFCQANGRLVLYSGDAEGKIFRWESLQLNNALFAEERINAESHADSVACLTYNDATGTLVSAGEDNYMVKHTNVPALDAAEVAAATAQLRAEGSNISFVDSDSDDVFDGRAYGVSSRALDVDEEDNIRSGVFNLTEVDHASEPQGPMAALESNYADWSFEKMGQANEQHTDRITGLVCAGEDVISVSWDRSIKIWSTRDKGSLKHTVVDAHDEDIHGIDYCPEMDQFATASADKTCKVWDNRTYKFLVPFVGEKGHTREVSCIRWNAFHRFWVSGSEDHTLRCWDSDGIFQSRIVSRGEGITALCIDTKRGFVVAASVDRRIRIFDPISTELVALLDGHTDYVRALHYIPERDQYASCSMDHTICVWAGQDRIQRNFVKVEPVHLGDPRIIPPEDMSDEDENNDEFATGTSTRTSRLLDGPQLSFTAFDVLDDPVDARKKRQMEKQKAKRPLAKGLATALDRLDDQFRIKDEGGPHLTRKEQSISNRRTSMRPPRDRRISYVNKP